MSDPFEEVRREVDSASVPSKDLRSVVSRGQALSFKRKAGALVVCAAVVVAVVVGVQSWDPTAEPVGPAGSRSAGSQDYIPNLARVVCRQNETVVKTPRVQPQQDGIHIQVANEGRFRVFYIRNARDEGQNHGGRLGGAMEEVKTTMPPGEMWFGCFRKANDAPYTERAEEFGSITIVDPNRLWTDPQLECRLESGGRFTNGPASGAAPGDPEGIIRDVVPDVRAEDEMVKPGYPGTEFHGELRMIVRDDEVIASADVHQQLSRWEVTVDRCVGASIGE
jgi:hypothetical protein